MSNRIFSRTAVVLWLGATLGAALVIPYVEALTPTLNRAATRLGVSMPVIVLLSIAQSAATLAVLTFAGFWAARKLGLGAPLLDALLFGQPAPTNLLRRALVAMSVGLASGLVLVAPNWWLFISRSPAALRSLPHVRQPPVWAGLLACFEGGVTEEVEMRLFLLSVLALAIRGGTRIFGAKQGRDLGTAVFWLANILAAIAFGLGHLPVTSHLVPLTALTVTRIVFLNGAISAIAGYLFWRDGLEMAMLCHFSADLMLHVAAPLLQGELLKLVL